VEQALYLINLFFAGIGAGGLVMVQMVLIPLLNTYPDSESVHLHRQFDSRVDRYMPHSVIASGVAAIVLLVVRHDFSTMASALRILGVLGSASVAIISESRNKPINRTLKTWSADPVPAEYKMLRRTWDRFHALRTAAGVLAFVFYLAAVLAR